MAETDPVLAHWQFVVEHNGSSAVMPDGCRDLIRHVDSSGRPRWFVSELATRPETETERSLERWVGLGTGQRPGYWLGLARARRAAQRIPTALPLAELALEQGYTDQSHMNCEFRRWFGLPPGALRRSPELQPTLQEPGFN